MHTYTYIYTYIYTHTCTYIYIHTYTYIHINRLENDYSEIDTVGSDAYMPTDTIIDACETLNTICIGMNESLIMIEIAQYKNKKTEKTTEIPVSISVSNNSEVDEYDSTKLSMKSVLSKLIDPISVSARKSGSR